MHTTYRQTHCLPTLVVSLWLIAVLCAQAAEPGTTSNPGKAPGQPETLNNGSIIELKGLGLSESVIIDKIKASRCDFDVSVEGLKNLKAASVPDSVISAMLATAGAKTVTTSQSTDKDDPTAPHETGIWLLQEESGKPRMTKLEPSVYSQGKTGGGIFMAYGATVKSRAVLAGAHAATTIRNAQPTFYFYFERTESGLGATVNSATSPNEFILAQFEVKAKDDQRSLVMGQLNAYSGNKSGVDAKANRAIAFEKVAPGIYKVTPRQGLENGQYGFFYGGTATMGAYGAAAGGKVFDFAIEGSSEPPSKKSNRKART